MSWPTPQDYNEAMQNPLCNFGDPELQRGRPKLTPLGLPRPISGNFASVYWFSSGTRDWAVKCFTRNIPDQLERYTAISEHLIKVQSPYMTEFSYLREGIRIKGRWYPILKMQWLNGQPLNRYIQNNLASPNKILNLANQWAALVTRLKQESIAHCDLQHANILVENDSLKLIDYDGMYVPKLAGKQSNELGNVHYQHPRRSESHFGLYLDNFSAWVIYLALVTLGLRPDLARQLPIGDENLVLCKEDFVLPRSSPRLKLLLQQPEPALRMLARLFVGLPSICVESIPELLPLFLEQQPAKKLILPDWLTDQLQIAEGVTTESLTTSVAGNVRRCPLCGRSASHLARRLLRCSAFPVCSFSRDSSLHVEEAAGSSPSSGWLNDHL